MVLIDLPPDDAAKLAKILANHDAQGLPIQESPEPPKGGKCCGTVGNFLIFVSGGIVTLVGWLTLPSDIRQICIDFKPATECVGDALVAMTDLEYRKFEPGWNPASDQHHSETILPTTTTTPDPSTIYDVAAIEAGTGTGSDDDYPTTTTTPPPTVIGSTWNWDASTGWRLS